MRKGLKLQLALAIHDVLGFNHALTIPNAKRYVTDEVRRKYRIRKETNIDLEDWIIALQIVRVDHVSHFQRVSMDDKTPPDERFLRIIDKLHVVSRSPEVQSPKSQYV